MDNLRDHLVSFADDGVHIMVITDAEGRLLWREGTTAVVSKADEIGLVEGAQWDEAGAGTNAIGTALVVGHPVQVFGAEHFVRTNHSWVGTASPVHDPVDGRLLGVVGVNGPALTSHPSTLALVTSVARLAENELTTAHGSALEQLRTVAAPVLARIGGPALVVDRNGWVAAGIEMRPPARVLLPQRRSDTVEHVPPIGWCQREPFFDGWLIRVDESEPTASTSLVLDFHDEPTVTVVTQAGMRRIPLGPRHAEILMLLAWHREGRSAADLSVDLFGDTAHTVAVRAELSRLRRKLGSSLIDHRPYRFPHWLEVVCDKPDDVSALLPNSTAPGVLTMRGSAAALGRLA